MKIVKLGIFICLLNVLPSAFADSRDEAEKLLNAMKIENVLEESISQMLDAQLKQNPTIVPYKAIMMKFLNKHMSWESLKPEYIKIYSQTFTASELRDINAFYMTSTGKKTLKAMPALMAKGTQMGTARVQANIGELQSMIKAEAERLQKLNKQ